MKARRLAGEFRVMAYGDVSIADLFEAARRRAQGQPGLASIRSKTSFVEFRLPQGLRKVVFLQQLRDGGLKDTYPDIHNIYWNPDGPALALVLGYRARLEIFRQLGTPTPKTLVVFTGTAFI